MNINTSKPPSTFEYLDGAKTDETELSSPEEQEETYWACIGNIPEAPKRKFNWFRHEKDTPEKPLWAAVFATAEEAEAHAASCNLKSWVWNKKPAHTVTLKGVMRDARINNRSGVCLLGYDHSENCWVVLKEWPTDVPLE